MRKIAPNNMQATWLMLSVVFENASICQRIQPPMITVSTHLKMSNPGSSARRNRPYNHQPTTPTT